MPFLDTSSHADDAGKGGPSLDNISSCLKFKSECELSKKKLKSKIKEILNQNRNNLNSVAHGKYIPNFKEIFQIIITFSIVTLAWILFRSESIYQAMEILLEITSYSIFEQPLLHPIKGLAIPFLFFIIIEWLIRENEKIIHFNFKHSRLNHIIYVLVIGFIFCYGNFDSNQFIYFQF